MKYRVMVQELGGQPWQYASKTFPAYEDAVAARKSALRNYKGVVAWVEYEQTEWVVAHA